MRKHLQNIVVLLFSALLMLTGMLLLPAGAAEARLFDEGDRLTAAEFGECEARLKQASDATGMNIAVILGVKDRSDLTIETTCTETYTELFGARTDGLVYYMDLKGSNPYDYIATSGLGQFYYTNNRHSDRVAEFYDRLDDYLYPVGSENVPGAVQQFAELTELFYQEGIPEHYYVYDDADRMYYHVEDGKLVATATKPYRAVGAILSNMFIGFVIGILAALLTFASVKAQYKFKSELSPTTYVNRKNVDYVQQYDNFTHTSTSRVHIQSSSSGGRSGGHSGGGHSHGGFGGGGHHR